MMKQTRKIVSSLIAVALLSLSLAACQSVEPAEKQSYLRLKCPACGYEFDRPQP